MNRALLILSSILILLSACKKAEEPASAEDDLRSGKWLRTSGRVTYKDPLTNGDSTREYIDSSIVCRLDNYLIFNTNFEGTIQLGTKHCSSGEADSKTFAWQMTADATKISLYHVADFFPTDNVEANVITRTLGYLTIRYKVISLNPSFQTYDTSIYTDVLRKF